VLTRGGHTNRKERNETHTKKIIIISLSPSLSFFLFFLFAAEDREKEGEIINIKTKACISNRHRARPGE